MLGSPAKIYSAFKQRHSCWIDKLLVAESTSERTYQVAALSQLHTCSPSKTIQHVRKAAEKRGCKPEPSAATVFLVMALTRKQQNSSRMVLHFKRHSTLKKVQYRETCHSKPSATNMSPAMSSIHKQRNNRLRALHQVQHGLPWSSAFLAPLSFDTTSR